MRVFIDSTVYLHFIRASKEKLDSLDNLEGLIAEEKVELIFPKITQEEVLRNMLEVPKQYCKTIDNQLPKEPSYAVSVDKQTRDKIKRLHAGYSEELKKLKGRYLESVSSLRERIFGVFKPKSIVPNETDGLTKTAFYRKLKGNPPGKGKRIGDELAWELLLEYCGEKDLFIVASDPDWSDPNNREKLHPLLEEEWLSKSNKKIRLFTTLGQFINSFTKEKRISKEEIEQEKKSTDILDSLVGTARVGEAIVSGPTGPTVLPPAVSGGTMDITDVNYSFCVSCHGLKDNPLYPICSNCRKLSGL
jgi:hypothetical protein